MSDVNVFILLNLGCEMLYVIDQRLRAQNITFDKSVQVLRDITGVLLDPTFIERLIIGSKQKAILTEEHCKFILNDFACCSLMRLDELSMSKLWDLITMVLKWQLEMAEEPQHLLWITYRHLDGISQLHPNAKKTMLVDSTKTTMTTFWNSHGTEKQHEIFNTLKCWFHPFTTKISIFIRLGFQNMDGSFNKGIHSDVFRQFVDNIGENIYARNESVRNISHNEETSIHFKGLAEQLKIAPKKEEEVYPAAPSLYFNCADKDVTMVTHSKDKSEFIKLKPKYTATSSWESLLSGKTSATDKKDLHTLLNSKNM